MPILLLDQVIQSTIQRGLGHFQEWGIHSFYKQCVPVPEHSRSKEFLPKIPSKPVLFLFMVLSHHPQIVPRSGPGLSPHQGSVPKANLDLATVSQRIQTFTEYFQVNLYQLTSGLENVDQIIFYLFIRMLNKALEALFKLPFVQAHPLLLTVPWEQKHSRTVLWQDLHRSIKLDHKLPNKATFTQELSKWFCKTCRYIKLVCFCCR